MNQDKYIFAQLVDFLDNNKFFRIVQKYGGDKENRGFTCWNQLLMMIFGQLSNRDSFRDLVTIIEAHKSKAYHLGFGRCVNLSTIAGANASRDYRIFEEFAMHIIAYARRIKANNEFAVKTEGNIYAFDLSTISLTLLSNGTNYIVDNTCIHKIKTTIQNFSEKLSGHHLWISIDKIKNE